MNKGCKRFIKDGIVSSAIDGMNPPFKGIYCDTNACIPWFYWKLDISKNEPETTAFIHGIPEKKIISELVKIEIHNDLKKKHGIEITDELWKEFLVYTGITNIGNPLKEVPITNDDFDKAHVEIAKSFGFVVMSNDNDMKNKYPDVVFKYGELRRATSGD